MKCKGKNWFSLLREQSQPMISFSFVVQLKNIKKLGFFVHSDGDWPMGQIQSGQNETEDTTCDRLWTLQSFVYSWDLLVKIQVKEEISFFSIYCDFDLYCLNYLSDCHILTQVIICKWLFSSCNSLLSTGNNYKLLIHFWIPAIFFIISCLHQTISGFLLFRGLYRICYPDEDFPSHFRTPGKTKGDIICYTEDGYDFNSADNITGKDINYKNKIKET